MKVYAYTRVSTGKQADTGESLETQKTRVTGYAMMNGWTITETFVEAGVSGGVALVDRPEGQRLLAALKPGDVVITPKLDRMFRKAVDALVTAEELKEQKVSLHILDMGGDVTGNGLSKAFFTMAAAFAELERDTIRERIRVVKQNMASRGLYNGGREPFGYKAVDGKLVPDDAQQATLASMLAMFDEGLSFAKIGKAIGMDMKSVSRILAKHGRTRPRQ